jgi:hypothetical protein
VKRTLPMARIMTVFVWMGSVSISSIRYIDRTRNHIPQNRKGG